MVRSCGALLLVIFAAHRILCQFYTRTSIFFPAFKIHRGENVLFTKRHRFFIAITTYIVYCHIFTFEQQMFELVSFCPSFTMLLSSVLIISFVDYWLAKFEISTTWQTFIADVIIVLLV